MFRQMEFLALVDSFVNICMLFRLLSSHEMITDVINIYARIAPEYFLSFISDKLRIKHMKFENNSHD